jgi:hypothetical protein
MKKNILAVLILFLGLSVVSQSKQNKGGITGLSGNMAQRFASGPVKTNHTGLTRPRPAVLKNGHSPNIVSVLTIGSDVTAWNCGYNGIDHKTMLWADDTLKVISYVHGMGPMTADSFFSRRLGMDLGINTGMTASDWTSNQQIYSATMNPFGNGSLPDEVIMSQAAIYSPPGNTSLENAYIAYFAVNDTRNMIEGGYSHGAANLLNPADSSKTLYGYAPPPYTYLPQGFTITQKGISLMTDISYYSNPAYIYQGEVILGRGIWNPTARGFEYTLSTLSLPTTGDEYPYSERVAASPDGNTVWIVILANNGGAEQIGQYKTYYPVLFKSADGGLTWSDPIAVQLDGPNGIEGVKNYLSDHMIEQLFNPPYPGRDEIGYGTAFDCDLSVDKWGNPHVAVDICVPTGDYYVNTVDSSFCVFDIYSIDGGITWEGAAMGYPATFRGNFGSVTEDNRVHVASTEAGDKMFVTWNDTQIFGFTTNDAPDVFARGFDLVTNKITSSGGDLPNNVTSMSDLFEQAYFESTSHYVFTGNNKYTIPIVTEMMSDPNNMNAPVTFKYIPDFSYTDADFTIPVPNPGFPVGIDQRNSERTSVSLFPNPVQDLATVTVTLNQGAKVSIGVTSLAGQKVLFMDKGTVGAGVQQFTVDAGSLSPGVYILTVFIGAEKYSKKMVVE